MTEKAFSASGGGWRRWFRFRLSTLFVVFTILSLAMGWFGVRWYRGLRQEWAVEAVQSAGGVVVRGETGSPVRVYMRGPDFDDDQIMELVDQLIVLPKLRELDIVESPMTDEGLGQLQRLMQVELLYLHETQVSEAGIAEMKAARPKIQVRLEEPDPVATKLTAQLIYPHAVVAVAYSPDGAWFVTGSGDGKLRWWRSGASEPIEAIQAHDNWVFSAVFSPDGKSLATGGGDNSIRLWDVASRKLNGQLAGHEKDVHSLSFDPSGERLYSAGDDQIVRVWEIDSCRQISAWEGHQGAIPSLAISPDGRRLASASRDGTVRVWDTVAGRTLHVLDGSMGHVVSVAFSPDGRTIASAGYDGEVRLWDAASGAAESVLSGHTDWVFATAFFPDGRKLASASADGTVRIWDLGECVQTAVYRGQQKISAIRFSPDARTLVTTSAEGSIFFRNPDGGRLVQAISTRFGDREIAMLPYALEAQERAGRVQLLSDLGNP